MEGAILSPKGVYYRGWGAWVGGAGCGYACCYAMM